MLYENESIKSGFDRRIKLKDTKLSIFLYGNSDRDNLDALSVIKTLNGMENCRVFVEMTSTSWDHVCNVETKEDREDPVKGPIINYVWTDENFAYNNLLEHSIFRNAVYNTKEKQIHILFIGFDNYSLEMMKCILWLGQMPGYQLRIDVIEAGNDSDKLFYQCPGLKEHMTEDGLAKYEIRKFSRVDYESAQMRDLVRLCGDFTFAFINTGSETQNGETAIQLAIERSRIGNYAECVMQMFNHKAVDDFMLRWTSDYHVRIEQVGTDESLYKYETMKYDDGTYREEYIIA